MQPIDFKARNRMLGAPRNWDESRDGPCGALHVHHEEPDGLAWTSCWRPTELELRILNDGGLVWLEVCSGSTPQPAVMIYANYEDRTRSAPEPTPDEETKKFSVIGTAGEALEPGDLLGLRDGKLFKWRGGVEWTGDRPVDEDEKLKSCPDLYDVTINGRTLHGVVARGGRLYYDRIVGLAGLAHSRYWTVTYRHAAGDTRGTLPPGRDSCVVIRYGTVFNVAITGDA